MKKEAINTFGEGLIMDLNPLTTPNNVLTNALNGTIVTYNGNEFVLQNDMGNGEVHTAYLDKGYVPVGMKEHGGIIYVAAHNPVTGKSQMGSFPSPQQLYEGDDLNITPIDFSFTNFIEMRNGLPFIKLEYYKQKLFQELNTDEVKIFHPGDKFVIVSDIIGTTLRKAIKKGVIRLRLGVVNSSGNIDYIDEDSLKLYENGLWIYENSNTPMADVLRANELVQVFSAKSSGALILVIEFKTFDTFNLIRKYSYADKLITVTMTGETKGIYEGKSTTSDDIKLLHENELKGSIVIRKPETSTEKVAYSVMPACPYGILERMEKKGTLDFEAIKSNKETFGEWRFFITDTYLKIGWGYDYYNLNEDEDIEKIQFTFININRSSEAANVATLDGDYSYDMSKEYFNGSFEEIIPFGDNTIQSNWVYLIRVDKYIKGVKEAIGYRLLYTGTYFNDYFEENSDFTQLSKGTVELKLKEEVRTTAKVNGTPKTFLKTTKTGAFTEKSSSNPADYITTVSSPDADTGNYQYTTKRTGVYDIEVAPSVGYKYDSKLYAGVPTSLDNFFGSGTSLGTPKFDDTGALYNSTSPIISNIAAADSKVKTAFAWNNTTKSLKGQVETSRSMFANAGGVKTVTSATEVLGPLYSSNMDAGEYSKLCSFRNANDILYCVTGDEDYCSYNSRIIGGAHTDGSYKGENGGSGSDEDGLRACLASMGNGTVGIFGGHDYDHASLRYDATRRNVGGWSCGDSEVDGEDNFLLGTWKDVNGQHWVINLASQKTAPNNASDGSTLIRLDMMLRCFLSQMCVVKRGSSSKTFVGPNSMDFVYHIAFDTILDGDIAISGGGTKQTVDFFLGKDASSIAKHVTAWKKVVDTLPKAKGLVDFLPVFEITKPTSIHISVPFGNNVRVDNDSSLLSCYTSAYSFANSNASSIDNSIDRNKIYIGETTGKTNADGSMELATDASTGRVKVKSSDRILMDWRNRSVDLGYNLNDRFINAYKKSSLSGEIQEGFYNEVFIQNISTVQGKWTKGKDSHAPDMAKNISFGAKSIYT